MDFEIWFYESSSNCSIELVVEPVVFVALNNVIIGSCLTKCFLFGTLMLACLQEPNKKFQTLVYSTWLRSEEDAINMPGRYKIKHLQQDRE